MGSTVYLSPSLMSMENTFDRARFYFCVEIFQCESCKSCVADIAQADASFPSGSCAAGHMERGCHVAASWEDELQQRLPRALSAPCKLSLGLNVDGSEETRAKLCILVDYLKGQFTIIAHTIEQTCHQSLLGTVFQACCFS